MERSAWVTGCRGLAERVVALERYVFLSCRTNAMVLNVLYTIGIYMGMTGQSLEEGPIYI